MFKKLLGGVWDVHTPLPQIHSSLITIEICINSKLVQAMVDTGATTSLIVQSELQHIKHPPIQPVQMSATIGDGKSQIMVNGTVELRVHVNDITTTIAALIVQALGANLILGMDWCKLNNVNVNVGKNRIEVNHPQYGTTTIPFLDSGSVDVQLAESITLLPHHEHIGKIGAPILSDMIAAFSPDSKECSK
jgi:predicted aspartyl protease